MPRMTRAHFVQAVEELQDFPGHPVCSSRVQSWCEQQLPPVDIGLPTKSYWWNADIKEGRTDHRLLKFKESPNHNGTNYFALSKHEDEARRAAFEMGLYEVPWDHAKGLWDWKRAAGGRPRGHSCAEPTCGYLKFTSFGMAPGPCARCGGPMVERA